MTDRTTLYEENMVLRSTIKSPILFKEDLRELGDISDWVIKYNKGSGAYEITRDYSQHAS